MPLAELRDGRRRWPAGIAANAPLSVRAAKSLVYLSAEHGWTAALDAADELYEPVYLSEDAQEGPRVVPREAPAAWQGR